MTIDIVVTDNSIPIVVTEDTVTQVVEVTVPAAIQTVNVVMQGPQGPAGPSGSVIVQDDEPAIVGAGGLWFRPSTQDLFISNGTQWVSDTLDGGSF